MRLIPLNRIAYGATLAMIPLLLLIGSARPQVRESPLGQAAHGDGALLLAGYALLTVLSYLLALYWPARPGTLRPDVLIGLTFWVMLAVACSFVGSSWPTYLVPLAFLLLTAACVYEPGDPA